MPQEEVRPQARGSELEARIQALSPDKRALLERQLERVDGLPIPSSDVAEEQPLSVGQRWVWAFEQFNPNTPVYNLPIAFRINGPFDEESMSRAVDSLCEKHPALRSRVRIRDGAPWRRFEPAPRDLLQVISLEGDNGEERARAWVDEEVRVPFDLREELPIRVSLLRLGEKDRVLLIVVHHIVSDGWSFGALLNDLTKFYQGDEPSTGQAPPTVPPMSGNDSSARDDADFWAELLSDPPEPLTLPQDRSLPQADPWDGGIVDFDVPATLDARLAERGRTLGATPFMLWLASFSAVIHRHSGQDDFLVGVPVARRDSIESLEVVDYLVDMVPLRLRFPAGQTFRDLIDQIKTAASQAFQRADGALDYVIEHLSMSGTDSMYQVALTFQHGTEGVLATLGHDISLYDVHTGTCKFDLTLMFGPKGPRVGQLEFRRKHFEAATIERFAEQLVRVLSWAVDRPDTAVTQLPLLSDEEERHWTTGVNQTTTDYPKSSIIHVFQEIVDREPNKMAVVQGDDTISYRELDERSTQVAHQLNSMALGEERRVGLYMERSIDLAVATLGIVKARATYVPFDPSYPDERVSFMLEDARIKAVIVDPALPVPDSLKSGVRLTSVGEAQASLDPGRSIEPAGGPEDPLYVMYTSGSTGIPKGVVVPHRAVVRLVRDTNYVQLTRDDVLGHISNVSFDAATFEIWGAFLTGGTLAVIDKQTLLSPPDLASALRRHGVSAMFMTAALFNVISMDDPGAFSSVHHLLVGGEALDVGRVRAVLQGAPPKRLLNGYGPTETTTFAAWHEIRDVGENDSSIPIGLPLANTYLYVLDSLLKPLPEGVPGQIFVGGDGVALGYLNDPELTRSRFIDDPFVPGGRMYATGDIGRRLHDGSIDYLGRVDRQVKLRGFRVELGEVETALKSHVGVADALVLVRDSSNSHKELDAYVVQNGGTRPVSVQELREHLKAKLPAYAIPGHIQILARLPLTPNGKIDRDKLVSMRTSVETVVDHDPPRDQLEGQVLEIWMKVLGTRLLGIDDDFFDVGGNSLLAVQLFSRIEGELGHPVDLATFMENPTVEGGARMLREEVERSSPDGLVRLNATGDGLPFYCVPAHGGNVFHLYALARRFAGDRPVYGLQGPPTYRFAKTSRSATALADYYVKAIRAIQPEGPYSIGGFSMGGLIAYEIGRRFELDGRLGLLAVVDSLDPEGTDAMYGRGLGTVVGRVRAKLSGASGEAKLSLFTGGVRFQLSRWRRAVALQVLSRTGRTVPLETRYDYFMRMHDHILARYKPSPFPGTFSLFATEGLTLRARDAWSKLAEGGLDVHEIPGHHNTLTESPSVNDLASSLRRAIDHAERAALDDRARRAAGGAGC